jgi:transcriptional regulator with PAS, ATPase and Fis domain
MCRSGQIEVSHLPEQFAASSPRAPAADNLEAVLKNVEAQAIREALKRNDNNRLAAAKDLGMHKSTLFRKMKALGISPPAQDGRSRRPNPK